jgi:hypothetical protein
MTKHLLFAALSSTLLTATLSAEDGWTDLFDGKSLTGWVKGNLEPAEAGGWVATDGVLHRKSGGGDLFSAKEYGNFELSLEWKIAPGGNSGIKYRVAKFGKGWLGPEYQVLDDSAHPDGKNGTDRQTAALYYLKPADPAKKKLNPTGEWNTTRIVVKGNHFEHFLNGAKVMDMVVGSDEWKVAYAKSKYKSAKGFAENPKGRIMLQDHGDQVWYRKIRIKQL